MTASRGIYRKRGTGHIQKAGYLVRMEDGRSLMDHVRIVQRVLGKSLPDGAVVHHIDMNPGNNAHTNLVVCPDSAFHNLLHQRQRAIDACGNASWLKCTYCKEYDAPENLRVYVRPKDAHGSGRLIYHVACENEKQRQRKARRLEKAK